MPGSHRAHYAGDYKARAAEVRRRAAADPSTQCEAIIDGVRCGLTLAEHPPSRSGARLSWQAGHVRDGDPSSPLRPEVSSCNQANGARLANRRRSRLRTTRDW